MYVGPFLISPNMLTVPACLFTLTIRGEYSQHKNLTMTISEAFWDVACNLVDKYRFIKIRGLHLQG